MDAEATKQKATERKGHLYLPHIYSLFLSWKLTGGFTQAEHLISHELSLQSASLPSDITWTWDQNQLINFSIILRHPQGPQTLLRQNEVGTFETVPNTQSLGPKKMRQRNASQKCHDSQNKEKSQ